MAPTSTPSSTPIVGTAAAAALFRHSLAGRATEALCIAYLDPEQRLIRLSVEEGRASDRIELPLRALVRDALLLDAHALILAHNHPGGSALPSRADTATTARLVEITRALDIRLVDHLIFAGSEVVSLRALGLL